MDGNVDYLIRFDYNRILPLASLPSLKKPTGMENTATGLK
jgi:hypothetical protein